MTKKLDKVKWEKFRLEELFEITGTKSLDSNAIEFIGDGINFVGRTFENNGVQGKIEKQKFEPNKPDTITATVIGNYKYVKLQKEPYYCSQNINKLTPKEIINIWDEKIAYFFVTNIQKFVSLYDGQQGGYKLEDIKTHEIDLPTKNDNSIDFEFMTGFISELEARQISELEAYLVTTGLSDYVLTSEEEKFLEIFRENEVKWKKFKIGDLFEVNSYKKRFDANKVNILEEGHPYVVRTALNNGIRGYLKEDEEFLNEGNTISFGQDTATMFYQEKPYFTGDKIKIIKSKYKEFNKLNSHFFVSTMSKSFSTFAWGSSSFSINIIENQEIYLPIKNNKIDFEFMEILISAIQKIIIKDVVLYSSKKIEATKKLVFK